MTCRAPIVMLRFLVVALSLAVVSCDEASRPQPPTAPTPPPPAPPPTPTTGTLSGQVSDASNGNALSGAAVAAGGQTAITGADGRYTLAALPAGGTTLTVQLQNYRNVSASVTINAGANTANQMMTPAMAAGFGGNWTGSWRNTTFGSTGPATATVTVNTIAQTITVAFDMGGTVFGRSDPPVETFTFPYTTTGGTFSGSSPSYGTISISSTPTGSISGNVVNPATSISRVDFTATVTATSFNGSATLTFTGGGGTANGTMTLTKQGGLSTTQLVWIQVVSKVRTWLG